jgi:CelD/BcsL family acetyltransferase involved in cellulose biosynthesis
MGATRIQVLRDWGALEPHAGAWSALVDRSDAVTVFQTYEWHEAWWATFGGDYRLCVLLAWDGDELRGIAPLALSRRGKVLQFIGAGDEASDYCNFIIHPDDPGVNAQLVGTLMGQEEAGRKIDLRNIPSASRARTELERAFAIHRRYVASRVSIDAPTRLLGDAAEDREALNKSSLKRHFNQMNRSGKLAFRQLDAPEEIAGLMDAFFAQHIARRAMTGKSSQFLDPRQQQLYRELVRCLAPRGWLKLGVVLFNDEPVAFHFGFEFKRRFVWYKPSFDPRYARQSPGEVLLRFLLHDAIERKLAEFDFTVGNEAFKYRFANHIRTNHHIEVFGSPFPYWRYHVKSSAKRLLHGKLLPLMRRLNQKRSEALPPQAAQTSTTQSGRKPLGSPGYPRGLDTTRVPPRL